MLRNCTLCPRNCGVNRLENELGFCNSGKKIKIAHVSLHMWEEPCISGSKGSGTIFFSNCNLKCVFCQNHKISSSGYGKEFSIKELSDIMISQQSKGAHNINLVTPTHYVPQIIEAIKLAKKNGLTIPIVYNTNSYENVETIGGLKDYIDIYLADLKYFNGKYAQKYSNAPDYFSIAKNSISEMYRNVGSPDFDEKNIMQKGIIIRHLMLPGLLFDSKKIIDYIFNIYGDNVYLSLMNQYTPTFRSCEYPEINKSINPKHYESLTEYCISKGIKNAFIQDEGTVSESFIPDFNKDF
ncbi:radical SAM protein [Clostridium sediminicola]|uniref:radical SAM protein n=1 Tax=Clostridium sediminicola TaxID=3114879 RepID=UPI003D163DBC